MRIVGIVVAVFVAVLLVVWQRTTTPTLLPNKGAPLSAISNGKTLPRVGLIAPLPDWIPLPEKGTVIGASVYPPQPPFGAAAVIMLKLDGTADAFTDAYGKRLARAGFAMRRLPLPPNLIIDAPYAQYEAGNRNSGNTVYVTIRSAWSPHYAQLTFWNPPTPRL